MKGRCDVCRHGRFGVHPSGCANQSSPAHTSKRYLSHVTPPKSHLVTPCTALSGLFRDKKIFFYKTRYPNLELGTRRLVRKHLGAFMVKFFVDRPGLSRIVPHLKMFLFFSPLPRFAAFLTKAVPLGSVAFLETLRGLRSLRVLCAKRPFFIEFDPK